MSTKEQEFQAKLRALVVEYGITLTIDTGYYGDIEGVDFCMNEKRVASYHTGWDGWQFEDGKPSMTFAQMRSADSSPPLF